MSNEDVIAAAYKKFYLVTPLALSPDIDLVGGSEV